MKFCGGLLNILDDAKIASAKSKKHRYGLKDGGGLFLLVMPNGVKNWVVIYRDDEKKPRQKKIGQYPLLTLKEARKKLTDTKRMLQQGINLADPDEKPHTFKDIALEWFDHWEKSVKNKPDTKRKIFSMLNNHVFPKIGSVPYGCLEESHVKNICSGLDKNGFKATARLVLMYCKIICIYANNEKNYPLNTIAAVSPRRFLSRYTKAHRKCIEPQELPDLMHKIETLTDESTHSAHKYNGYTHKKAKYGLQLMLMLWSRTRELLEAKKSEFDLKENIWRIPAERMKKARAHIVPLSTQAVKLIELISEDLQEGDYLFFKSGRCDKNILTRALEHIGYKGRMTGHGFRHLASTILNEKGFSNEHIKAQLSHAKDALDMAYNSAVYLPFRREIMQQWGDFLESIKI